jgi:hypothetical protein
MAIMAAMVQISGLVIVIMMFMRIVCRMVPMVVVLLCSGSQAEAECSDDGDVFYEQVHRDAPF